MSPTAITASSQRQRSAKNLVPLRVLFLRHYATPIFGLSVDTAKLAADHPTLETDDTISHTIVVVRGGRFRDRSIPLVWLIRSASHQSERHKMDLFVPCQVAKHFKELLTRARIVRPNRKSRCRSLTHLCSCKHCTRFIGRCP